MAEGTIWGMLSLQYEDERHDKVPLGMVRYFPKTFAKIKKNVFELQINTKVCF